MFANNEQLLIIDEEGDRGKGGDRVKRQRNVKILKKVSRFLEREKKRVMVDAPRWQIPNSSDAS